MDFFKVKCQLLIVYFVGFGCQPTILLHTMRQSFEPSYTQIQAVLVIFFSQAIGSQPFHVDRSYLLGTKGFGAQRVSKTITLQRMMMWSGR